jgi:hypothetical protein
MPRIAPAGETRESSRRSIPQAVGSTSGAPNATSSNRASAKSGIV